MKILDLAAALAPECDIKYVGIRPGEKLHECMIGEDDGPYTYEFEKHYEIHPAIHDWYLEPRRMRDGVKVDENFKYSSELNTQWINQEELIHILKEYTLKDTELVKTDELNIFSH